MKGKKYRLALVLIIILSMLIISTTAVNALYEPFNNYVYVGNNPSYPAGEGGMYSGYMGSSYRAAVSGIFRTDGFDANGRIPGSGRTVTLTDMNGDYIHLKDMDQININNGWFLTVGEYQDEIYIYSNKLNAGSGITIGSKQIINFPGAATNPSIVSIDGNTVAISAEGTYGINTQFFDVDLSTGSLSQDSLNTGISCSANACTNPDTISLSGSNIYFTALIRSGDLYIYSTKIDSSVSNVIDGDVIVPGVNANFVKLEFVDQNTLAVQYNDPNNADLRVITYDFDTTTGDFVNTPKDSELIMTSCYNQDLINTLYANPVSKFYSVCTGFGSSTVKYYDISSSGIIDLSNSEDLTFTNADLARVSLRHYSQNPGDYILAMIEDQDSDKGRSYYFKSGECDPNDPCCDSNGYFLAAGSTGSCGNCQVCTGNSGSCSLASAGTDPGNDCNVNAWTCTGFGTPYSCSRERNDGYCDGSGNCREESDYINNGYVCDSGNEVIGSSTKYSSMDGADRCSTSTPNTGFGDLVNDVFACDGSGGVNGPDVGDKTTDCGTGCCYDSGSTASCTSSGSSNVNFYNFGTNDGSATDYCLSATVLDCEDDGDCAGGSVCSSNSCVTGFSTNGVYGESWIDPANGGSTVYSAEDIKGYCNIENSASETQNYYYTWYKNGAVYSTGNTGSGQSNGGNHLLNTIASGSTTAGEEWVFSCKVITDSTSTDSGWYNSTTATIQATPIPNTNTPSINPTNPYDNDDLEFNCSGTVSEGGINYNWELFLNGTSYSTGSVERNDNVFSTPYTLTTPSDVERFDIVVAVDSNTVVAAANNKFFTYDVSSSGQMTLKDSKTLSLSATYVSDALMIDSDTLLFVVSSGSGIDIDVHTIDISSSGIISSAVTDSLTVYTSASPSQDYRLSRTINNIFVLASPDTGNLYSFEALDTGAIGSVLDTLSTSVSFVDYDYNLLYATKGAYTPTLFLSYIDGALIKTYYYDISSAGAITGFGVGQSALSKTISALDSIQFNDSIVYSFMTTDDELGFSTASLSQSSGRVIQGSFIDYNYYYTSAISLHETYIAQASSDSFVVGAGWPNFYTYVSSFSVDSSYNIVPYSGGNVEILTSGMLDNLFVSGDGVVSIVTASSDECRTFELFDGYLSGTSVNVVNVSSSVTGVDDNWTISCQAVNPSYSGSWLNNSVLVDNHAPVVYESFLKSDIDGYSSSTVSSILDNNSLAGYCAASDADGHDVRMNYTWYRNGAVFSTGTSIYVSESTTYAFGGVIDSSDIYPADVWSFECVPYDGYDEGSPGSSQSVSVDWSNHLPVVVNVSFTPSTIFSDDEVVGWCNATDFDGDDVSYQWKWFNTTGGLVVAGSSGLLHSEGLAVNVDNLSSSHTLAGDVWTLSCRAYDGTGFGSWVNSSFTVLSTPPVMDESVISPSNPLQTTSLVGSCRSSDLDGDNVTYSYEWFKDGVGQGVGYNSTSQFSSSLVVVNTLDSFNTASAEVWILSCRANDGSTDSSWLNSSSVTILASNNVPLMVSTVIDPSAPTNNSVLLAVCNSTDADGDDVSYEFLWTINGLSNASGTTSYYTQGTSVGVSSISSSFTNVGDSVKVSCRSFDGNDYSTWLDSSTVTVSAVSDNPWIVNTKILPFNPLSADDLEGYCLGDDNQGDNLSYEYEWFKNGVSVTTGNTLPSTYNPFVTVNVANVSSSLTTTGDVWTLSCRASDGTYSSQWVNESVTITTGPTAPSTVTWIVPNGTVNNNVSFEGWCNATDPNGDDVLYYWNWTVDGEPYDYGYYESDFSGIVLNELDNIVYNATITSLNTPRDLFYHDSTDHLIVVGSSNVSSFDVSDPNNMLFVDSFFDINSYKDSVFFKDDYLALVDETNKTFIFDFSDPSNIALAGFVEDYRMEDASYVDYANDTLFVRGRELGSNEAYLFTINVSNPSNPSILDAFNLTSVDSTMQLSPLAVSGSGNLLYTSNTFFDFGRPAGSPNLYFFNVTDKTNIEFMSSENYDYNISVYFDVNLINGKLFYYNQYNASEGNKKVMNILGVSGTNVTKLSEIVYTNSYASPVHDLGYAYNNNLFYTSADNSIDVYDLSDVENPVLIYSKNTSYSTGEVVDLVKHDDLLFVLQNHALTVFNESSSSESFVGQGVPVNPSNVSSSESFVGEEWVFNCRAVDTTGLNGSSNTSIIVIPSIPPAVPVVVTSRISPTPSTVTNVDLEGYCNSTDVNGDNVVYHYTWFKNGVQDSQGTIDNGSLGFAPGVEVPVTTMSSSSTSHFDDWVLECVSDDGVTGNSSAVNSSVTNILNTPPATTNPTLSDYSPMVDDTVYCYNASVTDLDSDSISWFYQWYLNGVPMTGATSYTLDLTTYSEVDGDQLSCRIRAFDSYDYSVSYTSPTATIGDGPVVTQAYILPSDPYTDDTLFGYCAATDGLGPINFVYEWYNDGVLHSSGVINESTYLVPGWDKHLTPGTGDSYLNAVTTDSDGNVYFGGSGINLVSAVSSQDMLIKKFDPSGAEYFDWNLSFDSGGNYKDYVNTLTYDNYSDSVFVFGGSWDMFSGNSQADLWLKKIFVNGSEDFSWNKTIGRDSLQDEAAVSIVTDINGNVYLGMYARDLLNATSSNDWWIKKYSSNGVEDLSWNISYSSNGVRDDRVRDLFVTNDYLYVVGYMIDLVNSTSGNDWVIKRFYLTNGSEDLSWNKTFDYGENAYLNAVGVDSLGNVYVAGNLDNGASRDWVIKKFSENGLEDPSWNITMDYNGGYDVAESISIDSFDNVYVSGEAYNYVTPTSSNDLVIKKYAPNATLLEEWSYDTVSAPEFSMDTAVYSDFLYLASREKPSGYNWLAQKVSPEFQNNQPYLIASIMPVETEHFENWTFVCIANDNVYTSNPLNGSVVIHNYLPVTSNPVVNSTAVVVGDVLECVNTSSTDLDGDSPIIMGFQWYLNGVVIAGSNSNSLIINSYSSGDQLTCSVTPNDGFEDGLTYNSTNYATVTTSEPVITNVEITPSPLTTNQNAVCSWDYYDPDMDPQGASTITWLVNSAIVDVVTYSGTNPVLLNNNYSVNDVVTCEVLGNDGSVNSTNTVSASVTVVDAVSGGGGGSSNPGGASGQFVWKYVVGDGVCQYSLGEDKIVSPNDCQPSITDYIGCAVNDYRCFDDDMHNNTKNFLVILMVLLIIIAYLVDRGVNKK